MDICCKFKNTIFVCLIFGLIGFSWGRVVEGHGLAAANNDIITFEPDLFNETLILPIHVGKNSELLRIEVNSLKKNKLEFECLSTNDVYCSTEEGEEVGSYGVKIMIGENYEKSRELKIYVTVSIVNSDGTRTPHQGKTALRFTTSADENLNIRTPLESLSPSILTIREKYVGGDEKYLRFDDDKYYVTIVPQVPKERILVRAQLSCFTNDSTIPRVWLEVPDIKSPLRVDNIIRSNRGQAEFDIILKRYVKTDFLEVGKFITYKIKAKHSNIVIEAEVIANMILTDVGQNTSNKIINGGFRKNNDVSFIKLKDDVLIDFDSDLKNDLVNFNEPDKHNSLNKTIPTLPRNDIGKQELSIQDISTTITPAIMQSTTTEEQSATIEAQSTTLESRPTIESHLTTLDIVEIQSTTSDVIELTKNNETMDISKTTPTLSSRKSFDVLPKSLIFDTIKTNIKKPVDIPPKLDFPDNITFIKDSSLKISDNLLLEPTITDSKDPFSFKISENSKNGSLIGSLLLKEDTIHKEVHLLTMTSFEDYTFEMVDGDVILMCANNKLTCLDFEKEKIIEILVSINNLEPALVTVFVLNKDDSEVEIKTYAKEIKISNDKMMNQFLFSVMDEDGIDANTVELGGSAGKHFILQKVPDDDLYQIVLIESPRSGKSELEIIVKSVDPLGKKLTKSVPVKVSGSNRKSKFRKNKYEKTMKVKDIIKGTKVIHFELEGIPIDSVDFYILEGSPGWLQIEKYGGQLFVSNEVENIYQGDYSILIGAVEKESNKIIAKVVFNLDVPDGEIKQPIFPQKVYLKTVGSNQEKDLINLPILPINSYSKIEIVHESCLAFTEQLRNVKCNTNIFKISNNAIQIPLNELPRARNVFVELMMSENPSEKALVCLNINSDIIVRQNEIDNYSQLIFDKTKNFGTYQINTTLFENASPGKVLANLLSFNPLNGEQPKECKINGDLAEYFEVNLSNGDLILSKAIDYEALTNKNINIEILCQENKMNNVVVLMEIQVFGVNDNKPIITVETENDSNSFTMSENLQPLTVIFNFTIADNDMDDDFSIAIIGKGNSKFVTEKIGEKMYAFKSGPGSKFDFEKEKQYNLLMVVKDKAHNLKKYAFTVNFIDQNDNPPIMRNNYFEFKVVENWPEDVFVGSVIADDADEESSLKSMNFSISIQHGDFFKIDNKSGKIYTAKKLKKIDKELPYEMKITVTDSLNANFKNYSIVTMKIVEPDSIIRTEKRHLQFSKPQNGEIIKIDEKTEAFSVIYEVKMEFNVGVKDSSYEILEYDITDLENKSDSTFSIDKGTGMLRLNQPLDYEKKSKYSISISVSGINVEEGYQKTILFVEIQNGNNHLPTFETDYRNRLFTYNSNSINIASVNAVDRDFEPFNKIFYFKIENCGKNNENIEVMKESGIVSRKIPNSNKYAKDQRLIEICILASQSDQRPENIFYEDHKKDQTKIKIIFKDTNGPRLLNDHSSFNYIKNGSTSAIPQNINDLKIDFSENMLKKAFHKDQKFSIQSYSFTPAKYEEKNNLNNIQKNDEIFKMNIFSGDILINPKITSYQEGSYQVKYLLQNSNNISYHFQQNINYVNESRKMKFVFDNSVSKVGFRLQNIADSLNEVMEDLSLASKYQVKLILEDRIRKEKNGKSSICFHISENGIIKPVDEYVEFFQTLFAKYARLSDVYEDYGVRNIMNCNKPWSPHSKKGFSGSVQIREDTSIQTKIIVTISLIFVYVLFFLILYNCILIRYRNNLQLKKKAIKVTMDQKICALNATNFKQLAISSPQFAIGYNPNLMEY